MSICVYTVFLREKEKKEAQPVWYLSMEKAQFTVSWLLVFFPQHTAQHRK
jgi:hypothetical protein